MMETGLSFRLISYWKRLAVANKTLYIYDARNLSDDLTGPDPTPIFTKTHDRELRSVAWHGDTIAVGDEAGKIHFYEAYTFPSTQVTEE